MFPLSVISAAFQLQWAQIHHLDVCLGEVQCPTSQKYCFTEHHQKGRENIMEPGDLCNLPSFCSGTFWHKSILALFIEFYFILKVCFILSRFCFSWSCFVLFSYKWLDYESQMHLLDRHAWRVFNIYISMHHFFNIFIPHMKNEKRNTRKMTFFFCHEQPKILI